MILSESELSQRAANETLPLRDAFAVLFFVSVGMLFDPTILVRDFGPVIATVLIIVVGKTLAAFAIVRLFGHPTSTALTISASLAQIGEFSFILAGLGVSLGLLPERGRDLILAGAILSIILNPLFFAALDWWEARQKAAAPPLEAAPATAPRAAKEPLAVTVLSNHIVLAGYGRVGSFIGSALRQAGERFLAIEANSGIAHRLRAQGIEAIAGNAADPEVARAANLPAARCLLVAIPEAFESGQMVEQARRAAPSLSIIARAHSAAEVDHLRACGATAVVMAEDEIARAMLAVIPPRSAA